MQRRVFASGRVQGVSYRASTYHEAMRYPALRGFVKNLPDGRVEAVFLGEVTDVLAMVQWCSHGPPAAHVKHLEVIDEANDPSLPTFEIRR